MSAARAPRALGERGERDHVERAVVAVERHARPVAAHGEGREHPQAGIELALGARVAGVEVDEVHPAARSDEEGGVARHEGRERDVVAERSDAADALASVRVPEVAGVGADAQEPTAVVGDGEVGDAGASRASPHAGLAVRRSQRVSRVYGSRRRARSREPPT